MAVTAPATTWAGEPCHQPRTSTTSNPTASQVSDVDRRSAPAILEYNRICTSDSSDPTRANGHTGRLLAA
ncbi:hypothetical protein GCM10011609_06430 [Lentzea pudingi]|uniref:Uncharacterized protein n=1 Tax=Lentzea pudingi TaxID=1789439 RepID=A0ABQ2HC41_9PSEU|nr:hypothetical protein GCM10011609_06430 [Lentzea pudingi]